MRPRRPTFWVDRPAIMARLDSAHAVVALVGPVRSGRSSLLAAWGEAADATWLDPEDLSAGSGDAIVVDDADRLTPEDWSELGARLAASPHLRLRLSVHSLDALPPGWDVDAVTDLRVTFDEIGAYVEAAGSPLEPRVLAFATGGHVGSLRELVSPEVRDLSQFDAVLARAGRPWRLDADEARLAVPSYLTAEVVELLGGPADFLARADRAGLGAWLADGSTRVFHLVPTVRAATLAGLELDDAERRRLRLVAAEASLARDAPLAAFADAVRGDDLDLAVRALKAGGMALLIQHGYVVGGLLRPLSVNRLRRQPVMALALALVLNARRQNRLRAVEMFGVAVLGARFGAGRPVDRALTHVVESVALRVMGAGDGGVAAARRVARVLRTSDADELGTLGRVTPHLHVHAGISLLYGESLDEARDQFEHTLAASPEVGTELTAIGGLALADALEGERDAAAVWLELADGRVWPPERLDEYAGSLLRLAQAQTAVDELDFPRAAAALDTIWPIVDTIEHWPLMAHVRALVDIGTGQAAVGLERFRSLRRQRRGRFGPPAPVRRLLAVTESLLLLAVGRPVEARDVLGDPQQHAGLLLAALRVALVTGDADQALSLLVRVVPRGPRDRVTVAAFEAVLLRRLGREEESREVAAKAAELATGHRLRSPFMLLPPGHLDLFGEVADGVPEVIATPAAPAPSLTPRELVVLRELARTSSVEEIAAVLHVSVNTVKSQRRSVYRKLGAHSREEALAQGLRHGLLSR